MKKAFTLIELIFVIVIIGVLSAVALPKFSHLNDNAKISAELSTASAVQTAIDSCHGEWIVNEGSFTCGASIPSSALNSDGYPTSLGSSDSSPLDKILKNNPTGWVLDNGEYKGPASGSKGTTHCKENKPCIGKYWDYNATNGTFTLTSG